MAVTEGVGTIENSDVQEFLKTSRCGVLSLVDGDKPYCIAMGHYYDGKDFYFLTSAKEGQRKMKCIEDNANACYMIYDSRREKPEIIKRGIRCRSVLVEGPIRIAAIKEIDAGERGKAKVRILKLEVQKMENWQCPGSSCDLQHPWFERFPNLLTGL